MRWLLFLSRLAFICGFFFIAALVLNIAKADSQEAFSSTINILGVVLGLILIPITNLCYLGALISGKKLQPLIPRWLIIGNIIFLFITLFYIFYLNDPYYHQP